MLYLYKAEAPGETDYEFRSEIPLEVGETVPGKGWTIRSITETGSANWEAGGDDTKLVLSDATLTCE